MLRTIIWYIHFAVSLFFTLPSLFKIKRLKKNSNANESEVLERANLISSKWAMSQVRYSGARVHITGEENIPKDENVLFVSNHQSNFDIAIFMSYIKKDKGFIAKSELLKIPILRTWMEYLDCVFMDRKDLKSSGKAILKGISILKSGYSLVIFPEGTRSKSSTTLEFKSASFKLATKSKATIIPVTIDGTYNLMESNNNRIKPADVYVTIHKPVETKDLTKEEQDSIPEKVVNIIKSALGNFKE